MQNKKKMELLAPAGDLEKLKIAVLYGADAVYIGGEAYGLRAKAKNFDIDTMAEGVKFAHDHGVKVYVTANIFAHNPDFEGMADYFKAVEAIGVDALIISDLGVFSVAKEAVPNMEIHVSTQANNTNYKSAQMWYKLGAQRVVVARELSMKEIRQIRDSIPEDMEIEAFVHGAMCISYSGRCLLSNYLAGRDANKGACAHPCRWKYHLVEETRPGEYMPIEENERGTYIYNSKDLCMIEHIPDIARAGIYSLKIEGRMKTPFYVGTVVKAYRQAIDDYFADPKLYEERLPYYLAEVSKASHRDYTTAFYYGKPDGNQQVYTNNSYIREYDFIGMVPMGQKLFGSLNPVHTGGPMQVSIAFAEQHTDGYPWKINGTVRQEVFSLRGGLWFGTWHLLNYPANYSVPLYRFADFNAGWYASRNAAFQNAVSKASGVKLALDGDLIRYDSDDAGTTELAVRRLAGKLAMSDDDIHRQLKKGDSLAFEKTELYQQVFRLADKKAGKALPREILPGIQLESPKITRNLTTAWFAKRVDERRASCMARR